MEKLFKTKTVSLESEDGYKYEIIFDEEDSVCINYLEIDSEKNFKKKEGITINKDGMKQVCNEILNIIK